MYKTHKNTVKKTTLRGAICAGMLACGAANAATWIADGGTHNWDDPLNWNGPVPNANGAVADFNVPLSSNLIVNLPAGDRTIGNLVLGDQNQLYKITLTNSAPNSRLLFNSAATAAKTIIQTATSVGDEIAVNVRLVNTQTTVSNLSSSALSINSQLSGNNRLIELALECGDLVLGGNVANAAFMMVVNDGLLVCAKPNRDRSNTTLYNVTLNGGTIRMDELSQVAQNSNDYIFTINGGVVDMNGLPLPLRRVEGNGGVITSLASGAPVMLQFDEHSPASYGGTIQDGPNQVVWLAGRQNVLTLSGANTFSGGVIFTGIDVSMGHPRAFGTERIVRVNNSGNFLRSADENDIVTEYDISMLNTTLTFGSLGEIGRASCRERV